MSFLETISPTVFYNPFIDNLLSLYTMSENMRIEAEPGRCFFLTGTAREVLYGEGVL